MAVDEECIFGPFLLFLQFNYDILDVPVVVGHSVHKLEVERSPGLLDVHTHLVDRLGPGPDGLQLPLEEVHRKNLILVTAWKKNLSLIHI